VPSFTQEQWFELFRFALYPLFVWIIQIIIKRAIKEGRDAIDVRADVVATKRAEALRKDVADQLTKIHDTFKLHEARDEQWFAELRELILNSRHS